MQDAYFTSALDSRHVLYMTPGENSAAEPKVWEDCKKLYEDYIFTCKKKKV